MKTSHPAHFTFRNPFSVQITALPAALAVLLLSLVALAASAQGKFTNGQNASLVIGQLDYTSSVPAVSQRGNVGCNLIIFDAQGNMWTSDQANSRILMFRPPFHTDMPASLVLGEPDFDTTSSPQPPFSIWPPPAIATTPSVFNYADRFIFDSYGNLWVTDGGNNRVLEFKPPFTTGMSASLVIGQSDLWSGEPGSGTSGLNFPVTPVFDAAGNLWVSEGGGTTGRVLEFKPPFTNGMSASLVIDNPWVAWVDQIGFDAHGNLWVADAFGEHRLLKFQPPFSNTMNPTLVIGQPDFTSTDPGLGKASLNFSEGAGFAFDPAGDLWVGDFDNNRVLKFKHPFRTGMDASLVLGQTDFDSNDAVATQSGMFGPLQVGFDSRGDVWVPDANNFRILRFEPKEDRK